MTRFSFSRAILGFSAIIVPATLGLIWYRSSKEKRLKQNEHKDEARLAVKTRKVSILYGSVTGTARGFAKDLLARLKALNSSHLDIKLQDLAEYREEDLEKEDIVFLITSTWTDGTSPEKCAMFFEHIKDFAYDFRVSKDYLSKVSFSCFGLGSAYYGDNYAKAARDAHEYLERLGAHALNPVARGDDQSNLEDSFMEWANRMVMTVAELSHIDIGASQKALKINSPLEVHESSNPQLTVEQKAELAKQRKQSKMKALNRTARGNSFQKQQLELGIGKAASKKPQSQNQNQPENGSRETKGVEQEEEEEEEEEEDRINNAFVEISDIDTQDVKGQDHHDNCCGSNPSECCSSTDKTDKSIRNSSAVPPTNPNLLPPLEDEEEEEAEMLHEQEREGTLDVEDLGTSIKLNQERTATMTKNSEPAAMVTRLQRKSLTKEGYRIIGTHSAVKLCRWTKNQMRGRGGCYKHTFYGITSYQCMEATPSLACASKCVFCWRHHKNPVGTEWRWKEDDPAFIVEEAVELHRSMINEMRGVPGVKPERLEEGYQVKHCALSLVGEPIMYPRINQMVKELHDRKISTFMVTNAQFPQEVKALDPVTQLYVSVDAATRDSLKAIDRPLFKDFWERFQGALKNMREKKQRTVYRLTLVSGWNMTEVDSYAQLVEEGMPDFIEIKAVTYCGKSDASTLTIENSPWHKDVCAYGEAIAACLKDRNKLPYHYSIATEHEHSCCILLAREDKFLIDGVWHTWIDYDKFQELMVQYYESQSSSSESKGEDRDVFSFSSTDYMARTPSWATYKSETRGFDPTESRWKRTKTGKMVEIEYKSSESGCG